jgi:hypothetical protein
VTGKRIKLRGNRGKKQINVRGKRVKRERRKLEGEKERKT